MWKTKLKELTKKHTQKAIAKRVNVPQPTISFWLSGRHKPSLKKIPALAEVLEMSVDELIKELSKE